MFDILESLKNEKRYVCIHADKDDLDKFIFGRIIGIDDKFFAVSMVSPDGAYDGILIKPIEDIVYVEKSISYEKKMSILMKGKEYPEEIKQFETNDLVSFTLAFAKKENTILSIELCHSGTDNVAGFIDTISDNTCQIKSLDEYGIDDGIAFIMIKDITQICFDSSDEKRLVILNSDIDSRQASKKSPYSSATTKT